MKITWNITSIERHTKLFDLDDVVCSAVWLCSATEEGFNHVVRYDGKADIKFDASGENFTQFSDLTEEQVLSWVFASGVDKNDIEAQVTLKFEECKSPKIVSGEMPWTQYYSPLETE